MSKISNRPATGAQIRFIHVAKAAAGLEDGEYRGMLEAVRRPRACVDGAARRQWPRGGR